MITLAVRNKARYNVFSQRSMNCPEKVLAKLFTDADCRLYSSVATPARTINRVAPTAVLVRDGLNFSASAMPPIKLGGNSRSGFVRAGG